MQEKKNKNKEENNKIELIKSDINGINLGNINKIQKFLDDKSKDIDITFSKLFDMYKQIETEEEKLIKIDEGNNIEEIDGDIYQKQQERDNMMKSILFKSIYDIP